MNSKPTRHSIDTLFTFLLLLSFLLFSLLVAGTGSIVYQNGTDSLNKNYTSRTALSYLTEKLRQHDHTDSISIRELDGIPSLVLYEEQNGTHYCTYLYFYDGTLRELFTQASNVPSADMGTVIAELSGFTFSVESTPDGSESVLLITVTDTEGRDTTARIHLSAAALSITEIIFKEHSNEIINIESFRNPVVFY